MSGIKKFLIVPLRLALIITGVAIAVVGLYWLISALGSLDSDDSKLATGVIVGIFTLFGAIYTVGKNNRSARELEIEAHFREPKTKIYDKFLKELFNVFHTGQNSDADQIRKFLQEWNRTVILWGGSQVVQSYIKWMNHVQAIEVDAESMFLMGDLILAAREDLGLSNEGINRQTFVFLLLANPNLFFEMAAENPDVTLIEMAAEKNRRKKT